MAQLTQRGLVYFIGETECREYKDKTYTSRVIILEQPHFDPYDGTKLGSNFIKLEATKEDICNSLENFRPNAKVDVEFVIRGNKYDKKDGSGEDVFTRLELRSIKPVGSLVGTGDESFAPAGASPISTVIPAAQPFQAASPAPAPKPSAPAPEEGGDDDLPFS